MKKIKKLMENELIDVINKIVNEQNDLNDIDEQTPKSIRTKFNDKEIKGITLAVKSISKKYKFIKGWEFHKDYEIYQSVIFINLIIDLNDVKEQYPNIEIDDFWFRDGFDGTAIAPYTIDDNRNDKIKNTTKKIKNNLNMLYSQLPEVYVKFYTFKDYNYSADFKCELEVSHFTTRPTRDVFYEI